MHSNNGGTKEDRDRQAKPRLCREQISLPHYHQDKLPDMKRAGHRGGWSAILQPLLSFHGAQPKPLDYFRKTYKTRHPMENPKSIEPFPPLTGSEKVTIFFIYQLFSLFALPTRICTYFSTPFTLLSWQRDHLPSPFFTRHPTRTCFRPARETS